jgi:hypothetical protein
VPKASKKLTWKLDLEVFAGSWRSVLLVIFKDVFIRHGETLQVDPAEAFFASCWQGIEQRKKETKNGEEFEHFWF